jgi:uncharacterized protein YqcC (DUF446 family)
VLESDDVVGTGLAPLLDALQTELDRLNLWETVPPPARALQSTFPFCCDTLRFSQWLQWVFMPRTRALLDADGAFPFMSGIRPMAEEALAGCCWDAGRLLGLLGAIDQAINCMPEGVAAGRLQPAKAQGPDSREG